MKQSSASIFFEQQSPQEITNFIDHSVEIADQIHDYLDKKGWSQKELAKKMGKTDAEVSKWLSGLHNLTLKSIAKMEAVLGEKIILTPKKIKNIYKPIQYVSIQENATTNINKVSNKFDLHKELGKQKFSNLKIAI